MKQHIIALCATVLLIAACAEPRGGPGNQSGQGWGNYRSGTWDSATERVRPIQPSSDNIQFTSSSEIGGSQSGTRADFDSSDPEVNGDGDIDPSEDEI